MRAECINGDRLKDEFLASSNWKGFVGRLTFNELKTLKDELLRDKQRIELDLGDRDRVDPERGEWVTDKAYFQWRQKAKLSLLTRNRAHSVVFAELKERNRAHESAEFEARQFGGVDSALAALYALALRVARADSAFLTDPEREAMIFAKMHLRDVRRKEDDSLRLSASCGDAAAPGL